MAARFKNLIAKNSEIGNLSVQVILMEMKKGKFTAEVTQIISIVQTYDGSVKNFITPISFSSFAELNAYAAGLCLLVDGKPMYQACDEFITGQIALAADTIPF